MFDTYGYVDVWRVGIVSKPSFVLHREFSKYINGLILLFSPGQTRKPIWVGPVGNARYNLHLPVPTSFNPFGVVELPGGFY